MHLKLKSTSPLAAMLNGHTRALLDVAKSAKMEDGTLTRGFAIDSEGDQAVSITVYKDGRVHVSWAAD